MRNRELAEIFGPLYAKEWLGTFYLFSPDLFSAIKCAFWDTFFDYDRASSYNAVLWTMSKELLGSYFIFGFLRLFGSWSWRFLLYLIFGLLFYFKNVLWLNTFVSGMAICDIYINHRSIPVIQIRTSRLDYIAKSKAASLVVVLAIAVFVGSSTNHGEWYLLMSTLICGWALISQPFNGLLRRSHFVFLGKISFSLYLIHLPIICSLTSSTYLQLYPILGRPITLIICIILTFVCSLGAGYLLYICADKPGIYLSKLLSKKIVGKLGDGTLIKLRDGALII